jgi:hypothetical protein
VSRDLHVPPLMMLYCSENWCVKSAACEQARPETGVCGDFHVVELMLVKKKDLVKGTCIW